MLQPRFGHGDPDVDAFGDEIIGRVARTIVEVLTDPVERTGDRMVALADALRRGDEQAAAAAQDRVKRAVEAVAGADIALIKARLALQGLPAGPPRVALDPPSPAQLDTLRAAIEELT